MRLAGLIIVIGVYLHINILPGAGSRCNSFSLCFVGLDLNDAPHYEKRNKNPGRCLRLDHGGRICSVLMESPQIGGFVEENTKYKVRRGAAKRLMAY
jgi:hypothetical protein